MSPAPTQLSREEIAHVEVGQTAIGAGVTRFLMAGFFATLLAVPMSQACYDFAQYRRGERATSWPQFTEILTVWRGVEDASRIPSAGDVDGILAANAQLLQNLHKYETRLEDGSFLSALTLGPTQQLLAEFAGIGNEKAYVGRDGWLFYRPGVEYLTGPGFLDARQLHRRAGGGDETVTACQPDPLRAILQFRDQLAERGITLVVMPTPVKPMIHPEQLSARFTAGSDVLQNASDVEFKQRLEAHDVRVFDAAEELSRRKQETGRPQFLQTDTHWTPAAMQATAEGLSEFLARHVSLSPSTGDVYAGRELDVAAQGDIALMLRLPAAQTLYPPQRVRIRQVVQATTGDLWEPMDAAEVLLLGDSFTNIYSLEGMHWGTAAGFAEQLSLALQRPVDRIAQNDAGAHATRQTLSRELAQGHDRLMGKKVVVWQFAIRELAVGDWKLLPLPAVPARHPSASPTAPAAPEHPSAGAAQPLIVRGTANDAAGMPQPGSVPYRDGVTSLHLVDLEQVHGDVPGDEIVVYLWGMQNNTLTSAAHCTAGSRWNLRLTPWTEAERQFGRFTRVELDDPDFRLVSLPTYWAEVVDEGRW